MDQVAQWTAEIVVNAPLKTLWEIVEDVTQIPSYHPEVDKVDLIAGQARRSLGTKYQCNILEGSRAGSCVEEVVAYEPECMVVTRMVSDTWGIDRRLADFRLVSTVSSRSDASTILKFEAFYKPVGLKNRLLNAWFLRRALRKRSLAVMNRIKRLAEGKVDGAMAGAPPVRERATTPEGPSCAALPKSDRRRLRSCLGTLRNSVLRSNEGGPADATQSTRTTSSKHAEAGHTVATRF